MDSGCGLIHDSIADISEDQLVERLFSDPVWGSDFFELAGMPRGMANRQRVLLNTAPGDFKGDIDVLLCDPDHPEQSVAYQIKRIKFGINQIRNGTPSKLQEYKKVAQQANLLAQMGFWQVYANVVVVVDAREQNSGRLTYAGLSAELKTLVDSAISLDLLKERVGLGILDFTQPMDYKPFTVGTHGLTLRRLSTPAVQSQDLTKWVSGLFSKPERLTS
jgi:hypothetical protein